MRRTGADPDRDLSTALRSGRGDNFACNGLGRDDDSRENDSIQDGATDRCGCILNRERSPGLVVRSFLAVYKYTLSPFLHALSGPSAGCRFQPTCSEYAALACHVHGPVRGTWLAGARLLRCHPFLAGGWDPVPGPRAASTEKTPAI